MLSWWLWLKLCAWGWFTDNWCLFVSLEVQRACYLHTSPISAVDSNSAWVRTCRRFGRKKKTGPPLLNTSKRLFFHDWQRVSLALKTWVCSCSETCGLWFAVPSYFADWILFSFSLFTKAYRDLHWQHFVLGFIRIQTTEALYLISLVVSKADWIT